MNTYRLCDCERCGEAEGLTVAHYEYADGYRVQRVLCADCLPDAGTYSGQIHLTGVSPMVTMADILEAGGAA